MTKPPPLVERMSISVKKEGLGYTSELTIDNAQMEDRAVYVCRAFAKESEVIDRYYMDRLIVIEIAGS